LLELLIDFAKEVRGVVRLDRGRKVTQTVVAGKLVYVGVGYVVRCSRGSYVIGSSHRGEGKVIFGRGRGRYEREIASSWCVGSSVAIESRLELTVS
jgi:hypothetical protein